MDKSKTDIPILDLRCDCKDCKKKTKDIYHLHVKCHNCGWKGVAILRKGEKPPTEHKCPHCECSFTLNYGGDPKFDLEDVGIPSGMLEEKKVSSAFIHYVADVLKVIPFNSEMVKDFIKECK